jgi:hypothetical protein
MFHYEQKGSVRKSTVCDRHAGTAGATVIEEIEVK